MCIVVCFNKFSLICRSVRYRSAFWILTTAHTDIVFHAKITLQIKTKTLKGFILVCDQMWFWLKGVLRPRLRLRNINRIIRWYTVLENEWMKKWIFILTGSCFQSFVIIFRPKYICRIQLFNYSWLFVVINWKHYFRSSY